MGKNYIAILYKFDECSQDNMRQNTAYNEAEYFELKENGLHERINIKMHKEIFSLIKNKHFFNAAQKIEFKTCRFSKIIFFSAYSAEPPQIFYFSGTENKISEEHLSVFTVYAQVVQYIRNGNFLNAAKLLAYFDFDKNSLAFLRSVLREYAFILLAFFRLFSFEKDKNEKLLFAYNIFAGMEDESLSNTSLPCLQYLNLLNYSKGFFSSKDFNSLSEEIKSKIIEVFVKNRKPIIVPLAGIDYTDAENYLLGKLKVLNSDAVKNFFNGNAKTAEIFFHKYFKECIVSVLPEPFNPHDKNAMRFRKKDRLSEKRICRNCSILFEKK